VAGEVCEGRALRGCTEQIRIIGYEVRKLRSRIEYYSCGGKPSDRCVAGHWNKRTGCCRGALPQLRRICARDQYIRIIASTVGNLFDLCSPSTSEVGQCEIDCSRGRALSAGQRVLSDEDASAAKRHPGRVDTIVHPRTAEVTASHGGGATDAIASDRGSEPKDRGIRADDIALRVEYYPSRPAKILKIGVERSPGCGCKGHVINKSIDAVSAQHRVPNWGVASGLDRDPIILCSRDQTLAHGVIGDAVDFKCGDVAAEPRPHAGVVLG